MNQLDDKYAELRRFIREMGSLMVAFSGGVDSTLLLKVAYDELGEGAAAITIDAPFHSRREIDEARHLAGAIGVRHLILNAHSLEIQGLEDNPPERCYICKKAVFSICREMAVENGFEYLADGSNRDDLGDYRPGRRALEELGVVSPLLMAGLGKEEIRELSRRLGLPTWDKPALACLLTRFPHGERITPERLAMVERCEEFLWQKGFKQFRVRAHGGIARVEAAREEFPRLMNEPVRGEISAFFRQAGFEFVTVDLEGYRCGSMNPADITGRQLPAD